MLGGVGFGDEGGGRTQHGHGASRVRLDYTKLGTGSHCRLGPARADRSEANDHDKPTAQVEKDREHRGPGPVAVVRTR